MKGMKGVEPASELARQSGNDRHSLKGDALFSAPGLGDFSVRASSPALKLGFRNFPMDRFGVRSRLEDWNEFCLDHCITALEASVDVKANKRKVFTVTREYHYI